MITRDGLSQIMQHIHSLVVEKFLRFSETTKSQMLWLLREMIRTGVNNVETFCWNVLRQAAGGDTSPKNLQLIEALLEIFVENRSVGTRL